MFIFYAVPTELKRGHAHFFYKHIVPTGLKRVYRTFIYKHIVPTGLKTSKKMNILKLTLIVLQHTQSNRVSIIGEGIVGNVIFVEYVRRRIR